MPTIVLVGAQWGDEGKGKATDAMGADADYVVKFNGGNNARHTVVVGGEKYALPLLPSPPATTTRRPPRRCSTPSSSPGFEVRATSTSACRRSTDSACSSDSASVLPASTLVISSSGSTGDEPTRDGSVIV